MDARSCYCICVGNKSVESYFREVVDSASSPNDDFLVNFASADVKVGEGVVVVNERPHFARVLEIEAVRCVQDDEPWLDSVLSTWPRTLGHLK